MVEMTPKNRSRLNLLVSYGGWRDASWADQLPRLLDPLGIHSIKVGSGRAATEVIRTMPVHIAVVDLAIPLEDRCEEPAGGGGDEPAGMRILQLLRRLDQPPPTVVVQQPAVSRRERDRVLTSALREGAFTVLESPVHLETLLEVMRRIVRRHYADLWPAS